MNDKNIKAHHEIGGGWGNHIGWFGPEQFDNWDGNENQIFKVHGHKSVIPKAGETLLGEFNNGFIKFRFTSVRRMIDPPDQFFGNVKPVEQFLKT